MTSREISSQLYAIAGLAIDCAHDDFKRTYPPAEAAEWLNKKYPVVNSILETISAIALPLADHFCRLADEEAERASGLPEDKRLDSFRS